MVISPDLLKIDQIIDPLRIIDILLKNGYIPAHSSPQACAVNSSEIMGCDITAAPIRVNVAGPDITSPDLEGRTYLSGAKFKLYGSQITSAATINNINTGSPNGTTSQLLYQTTIYAQYLEFHFAVPDGGYMVLLHYVESAVTGANKRIFDVYLEDTKVANDFDIFVAAGNSMNTAVVRSYNTNIVDGDLEIRFKREIENATIAGIEIIPLVPTTKTQAIHITDSKVSGCYLNGANQSKTTVSVEVAWENLLYTDSIEVQLGSQTRYIKPGQFSNPGSVGSIISPQVVAFELDANSVNGSVIASLPNNPSCTPVIQNILLPGPCPLISCNTGELGGQVFNDYDANGVQGVGENYGTAGVNVKVIDCNNNVATTTTGLNGLWKIGGAIAYPVRVEFSGLPATVGIDGTLAGTDGKTTVQFVNGPSCNIDLGVLNPTDYCQATPDIYMPCYVNGDPLPSGSQSGTLDAFIRLPYGSTGDNPPLMQVASASQVGSLWGVAYDKKRKKIYSSAFLRRHVGLGPLGLGGIYQTNISTNITSGLVDVESTLSISVGARNLGEPFYGLSNSARGLRTDPTLPSYDPVSFAQLGKVGIGDIDISDNSDFLYFVNLFDKKLYKLDITGPTPTLVNSYPIPSACTNGVMRPFGLKVKNGLVYVGTVCDGSISENPGDMRAYVHTFNETTNTFSTIFDFPLNYPKGYPFSGNKLIGLWNTWTDDFNDVNNQYNYSTLNFATWPQPMLTDIELDLDGSLILGFADRSGLQMGWHNYAPDLTDMKNYIGSAGGDVLRAAKKGNVYILENNAYVGGLTGYGPNNYQGPGFGEFYNDDFGTVHTEIAFGSLALKPGSGYTIYTAQDPLPSGNNAGGYRYISNTTGFSPAGNAAGARIYYNAGDFTLSTFGKAVGLGDLELTCGLVSYIEIGNRVWIDDDKDGIQDACEAPIENVIVELFKDNVKIAQTTTNSTGEYYFSSKALADTPADWIGTGPDTALIANTSYLVRISNTEGVNQQSPLAGTFLTLNNAGINAYDNIDSDGILNGTHAEITYTTNNYGYVNHTLDFGFIPECINLVLSQNTICYDNDTPSLITDNKIRFTATITNASALLMGYNVSINNGTTISPSSGVYGAPTTFTLGEGTAGGGNTFTITVTDNAIPRCTQTFQITDPNNCETVIECFTPQCGPANIQVNGD